MHKGDIVLVAFPFTDLSGAKVRPAVVLWASAKGEDFLAAFISSVPLKKKSPYAVPVRASAENGLKKDSRIHIDKLATLQKRSALGQFGILEQSLLRKADSALRNLLGL